MLADFRIEGYRCFRDLKLENLRRINLIAGKNSVGKSAVLEAVRLYLQPDREGILDNLDWREDLRSEHSEWTKELVRSLFRDGLPSDGEFSIRLTADQVRRIGIETLQKGSTGTLQSFSPFGMQTEQTGEPFEALVIGDESRDRYFRVPIDGTVPIESAPRGLRSAERAFLRYVGRTERSCVYVRSDPIDTGSLVALFESIVGASVEDRVVKTLRWVIPDAERLITKGSGDQRAVFVKQKGASGPKPLQRFGDGAVRLTAFALAMANCANGVCLIDEIENGIHHELFDQLWEAIARFAEELNVQVFATTHSKDCIEAFERSYHLSKFDAAFYRLERSGEEVGAVRLDHESYFAIVGGVPHEVR